MKLSTSAVRRNAANVWGAHGAPQLAKQPSKSNPKRDLLVAKPRREFATCFLQVALRVRPSSHGGFAGLGVDVTPDF